MKEQLLQIAEYIASIEARIAALESRSADLESRLQEACAQCEQMAALEARITELENKPESTSASASTSTSDEEPEIEVEFEFADDLQPDEENDDLQPDEDAPNGNDGLQPDDDTPNGYDGLQPEAASQPLDERSGLDLLEPLAQSPDSPIAQSPDSLSASQPTSPQQGEPEGASTVAQQGKPTEGAQEPEVPSHRGPVQTSLFGAPVNDIRHAISLGDRFLFQRELFAGNGEQMQKTLDEINRLRSYKDAVAYIERFGWNTESSTYELFLNVLRRRF